MKSNLKHLLSRVMLMLVAVAGGGIFSSCDKSIADNPAVPTTVTVNTFMADGTTPLPVTTLKLISVGTNNAYDLSAAIPEGGASTFSTEFLVNDHTSDWYFDAFAKGIDGVDYTSNLYYHPVRGQAQTLDVKLKVIAPEVYVASITLSQPAVTIVKGSTATLSVATVEPADATYQVVTWSSSDETVATVDEGGVVNGVAAGTAVITAKAIDGSGTKATCAVTILPEGALTGLFSVSATKKVWFSKGNLRATYDGTDWTWAFAENQYDYIANAAGNTSINGNGTVDASNVTVDHFGWVGNTSSTLTSDPAKYGISNSTTHTDYGTSTSDVLMSDWGTVMGSGWRTLTMEEWTYLMNTRAASTVGTTANARWAKAKVDGITGVIIFPDNYTQPEGINPPAGINIQGGSDNWGDVNYTRDEWAQMEAASCVFLPAAGNRQGSVVHQSVSDGYYWSSTPNTSDATKAYDMYFREEYLAPDDSGNAYRRAGYSVRLVYE